MIQSYSWCGGGELLLQKYDSHELQIIVIEPLFEEYNRTKKLITDIARTLARTTNIGLVFPNLPGTGESLTNIGDISLTDWHDAVTSACTRVKPAMIASFRGGALLDAVTPTLPVWRFAPETGARITRDLRRARLGGTSNDAALYAGHRLSEHFLGALSVAEPAIVNRCRTVRIEGDANDADAYVPGAPLWRRAEPGEDLALATALANDLAAWVMLCVAS